MSAECLKSAHKERGDMECSSRRCGQHRSGGSLLCYDEMLMAGIDPAERDLLGRAGHFTMGEDALVKCNNAAQRRGGKKDEGSFLSLLMPLLSSCKKHSNVSLREQAIDLAVRLQPTVLQQTC